jgi:DNA-binding NarL/FixJ family response regulator
MSLWQCIKRLRIDSQQKKTYSSILGEFPQFKLTDSATQETRTHEQQVSDSQAVSQSNDPLYQRWLYLAPRDQDIIALICLGYSTEQIAYKLNLTPKTVRTYIYKNVFQKLDVHSKTEIHLLFFGWNFNAWD